MTDRKYTLDDLSRAIDLALKRGNAELAKLTGQKEILERTLKALEKEYFNVLECIKTIETNISDAERVNLIITDLEKEG